MYIDAPVDTGRKLNVHKTFNLRPVPTGAVEEVFSWKYMLRDNQVVQFGTLAISSNVMYT